MIFFQLWEKVNDFIDMTEELCTQDVYRVKELTIRYGSLQKASNYWY